MIDFCEAKGSVDQLLKALFFSAFRAKKPSPSTQKPFFNHNMNSYYKALRVFAAALLCPLFQECARDIPTPITAPTSTAPKSLLQSKLANDPALRRVVVKQERITVSPQKSPKQVNASRLLEPCYDYFYVYVRQ